MQNPLNPSEDFPELEWGQWVTYSTRELREAGVDDPALERLQTIGTERPYSSRWLLTLGMWGGIYTARQIADELGAKGTGEVYAYQRSCAARGIPLRLRKHSAPGDGEQFFVALNAKILSDKGHTPQMIAHELGILPPAAPYYVYKMEMFEELANENDPGAFKRALKKDPDVFQNTWNDAEAGFRLSSASLGKYLPHHLRSGHDQEDIRKRALKYVTS